MSAPTSFAASLAKVTQSQKEKAAVVAAAKRSRVGEAEEEDDAKEPTAPMKTKVRVAPAPRAAHAHTLSLQLILCGVTPEKIPKVLTKKEWDDFMDSAEAQGAANCAFLRKRHEESGKKLGKKATDREVTNITGVLVGEAPRASFWAACTAFHWPCLRLSGPAPDTSPRLALLSLALRPGESIALLKMLGAKVDTDVVMSVADGHRLLKPITGVSMYAACRLYFVHGVQPSEWLHLDNATSYQIICDMDANPIDPPAPETVEKPVAPKAKAAKK